MISKRTLVFFLFACARQPQPPTPVQSGQKDYDWMEFFAGNAACTTYTRLQGHRGVKFDLKYNQHVPPGSINYMDINSPSGFVCFGCI